MRGGACLRLVFFSGHIFFAAPSPLSLLLFRFVDVSISSMLFLIFFLDFFGAGVAGVLGVAGFLGVTAIVAGAAGDSVVVVFAAAAGGFDADFAGVGALVCF